MREPTKVGPRRRVTAEALDDPHPFYCVWELADVGVQDLVLIGGEAYLRFRSAAPNRRQRLHRPARPAREATRWVVPEAVEDRATQLRSPPGRRLAARRAIIATMDASCS